jgi:hypothetical protein
LISRQFFYPRPQPEPLQDRRGNPITAPQWVSLAGIPFIRLGGVLRDWLGADMKDYPKLVTRAQEELDVQSGKVCLHLAEGRISVAERSASLRPKEFFVYVLLVLACQANAPQGFLHLTKLQRSHLEQAFRLIVSARRPDLLPAHHELQLETDADLVPKYNFVLTLLNYVKQRDVAALERDFNQIKAKVEQAFTAQAEQRLPVRCLIRKQGQQMTAAFGLEIPPTQLQFVHPDETL